MDSFSTWPFVMEGEIKLDSLEIKIQLDPVSDGIIAFPKKDKIKDQRGIVIGTNGEYRIVNAEEVADIFNRFDDNAMAISTGDYVGVFDERKAINISGSKYLVGSMLIFKSYNTDIVMPITEDDIARMIIEFKSRIVTLTTGKENFSAYEINS